MRTLLLLVLLMAVPMLGIAQMVNFDSIVAPLDSMSRSFPEYLVQLAWLNRSENAILQKQANIAALESKNTQKEFLRDLGVSFNINEGNIQGKDEAGNIFFPRWNVGLGVNVYNIICQPTKNRISRERVAIANLAIQDQKLMIRRETLILYEQFKAAQEALKFRSIFEQDAHSNYVLVQELYHKDEATFQDYSEASGAYAEAQEMRLKAETEIYVAQLNLEERIGMRWENVIHPAKTPN